MAAAQSRPAKYQPKGLTVLHEDRDIIIVAKPCGLLTIGTERDKAGTVHSILNDYVRKGDPRSRNRIFVVHRLDRETSGILVFAKSEQIKKELQENWPNSDKYYLAVVHGTLTDKKGTISSYLTENSAFSVYSTPDQALGKLSHTEYRVLKENRGFSLLEIHLLTGRKHQIRVHLSESGHPIVGDRKYGKSGDSFTSMALHAGTLSFPHPVNGRRISFETAMPEFFVRLMGQP